MDTRLLAQPFKNQSSAHEFLTSALADPAVQSFLMAVAWVRSSGIDRLSAGLENLRARGGRAEALIGIDHRGTSRQGLQEVMRVFDRVHVVHDVEGRTFHSKLFLARGPGKAHLLVGSNNLTAGGLFYNYEAALASTLRTRTRADRELLDQIEAYVRGLRADRAVCVNLTRTKFERLVRGKALEDERRPTREHAAEDKLREGPRSSGLFTRSAFAKRGAPPFTKRDPKHRATEPARGTPRSRKSFHADQLGPDTWWKKLGQAEAQRLPHGHSTGAVRITRLRGLDRDPGEYFRKQLFDTAVWKRSRDDRGNPILVTDVEFDVTLGRKHVGRMTLQLDYGKHREGGKARATTNLRLGPIRPYLLQRNYTDWFLVIERTGTQSYSLRLTKGKPI